MPKIKIYTTSTCGYCKAEKAYLQDHNLDFEESVVDSDLAAAEEMVQLSGQMGVPFTIITTDEGTTHQILGFDQPRLNHVLGLSGN